MVKQTIFYPAVHKWPAVCVYNWWFNIKRLRSLCCLAPSETFSEVKNWRPTVSDIPLCERPTTTAAVDSRLLCSLWGKRWNWRYRCASDVSYEAGVDPTETTQHYASCMTAHFCHRIGWFVFIRFFCAYLTIQRECLVEHKGSWVLV